MIMVSNSQFVDGHHQWESGLSYFWTCDVEDEQRYVKKIIIVGLQAIAIRGQIRARAESGTEAFQNVSIDEILSWKHNCSWYLGWGTIDEFLSWKDICPLNLMLRISNAVSRRWSSWDCKQLWSEEPTIVMVEMWRMRWSRFQMPERPTSVSVLWIIVCIGGKGKVPDAKCVAQPLVRERC